MIHRPPPPRKATGSYEIRKPTFGEMGLGWLIVTVGIAVKPTLGDFIVTVSDQRQSFQDLVPAIDDGPIKVAHIAKNWGFLFAGAEMGFARTIQRRANALLGGDNAFSSDADPPSLDQAKDAVIRAFRETDHERVHHRYLQKLGFKNVEDFLLNSGTLLGASMTRKIASQISKNKFNMELLLFGFDNDITAKFLYIDEEQIIDRSVVNSWAVGSGHLLAMGALNANPIVSESIEEYIYRACAAKFASETADGVGKTTSVYVWFPRGKFAPVTAKYVNMLRDIWERERRSGIPPEAEKIIDVALQRSPEFKGRSATDKTIRDVTTWATGDVKSS